MVWISFNLSPSLFLYGVDGLWPLRKSFAVVGLEIDDAKPGLFVFFVAKPRLEDCVVLLSDRCL